MIVFSCSLSRNGSATKVEFKVQVCEHLSIFHLGFGPHLLHLLFVFESVLELFQKLLHAWFIFCLPLDLSSLLFSHGFVHDTREVVLVDHLRQVHYDFLLELVRGEGAWRQL